jgi:hypothetical protein
MLTGAYHLSQRGAQKLRRELFGISISIGGMEGRASEALKLAYAEAEHEVNRWSRFDLLVHKRAAIVALP